MHTDSIWQSAALWLHAFWQFLPELLPRWFGAWATTLLFLIYTFGQLRPLIRDQVKHFDETMGAFARRLRYKLEQVDAALEPQTQPGERVLLTWFFRFWTNFASAPSLSVIAIGLAIWMFHHGAIEYRVMPPNVPQRFHGSSQWLLPALCYFGSMGLSYVLKRIFRRPRPERKEGAFGHRLRDGSFPSGHSLTAFCFWMMCVVSMMLSGAALWSTLLFGLLAIAIVLLTGLSRIYMAVHWPTDVAGGYVIGAVWTVVCFFALRGLV